MMIVRKAYRYKLKTNDELQRSLMNFAGQARFVWNKALAWNKDRLRRQQGRIYYNEMAFWLTLWKQSEEYGFLKESHAQCLQQVLKDLERAFQDAFDPQQPNKRFPRFKKKGEKTSFRYVQGIKIENRRIFLPKVGWVRFYKSQKMEGALKNVTVSWEAGQWYISVQTEQEVEIPCPQKGAEVGIDRGIACFAALSTGAMICPLNPFRRMEKTLKHAQQKFARQQKGSSRWQDQKAKIQKIHQKVAACRQDFLHKLSTDISKNHAIVYLEDLNIKGMSRSAKGTVEDPGRNVKAKSGLNKAILDQGWGEFHRQLTYKMMWNGGRVVMVPAPYTSQRCARCGHIDKQNRLTQDRFYCQQCGHEDHADVNAAKNIKAVGQTVSACQANPLRDRQQEPLRSRKKRSA